MKTQQYMALLNWAENVRWIKQLSKTDSRFAQRLETLTAPRAELWQRSLKACTVLQRYFDRYEHIAQCAEFGCPDDICEEQAQLAHRRLVADLKDLSIHLAEDGHLRFDPVKTPFDAIQEECGCDYWRTTL